MTFLTLFDLFLSQRFNLVPLVAVILTKVSWILSVFMQCVAILRFLSRNDITHPFQLLLHQVLHNWLRCFGYFAHTRFRHEIVGEDKLRMIQYAMVNERLLHEGSWKSSNFGFTRLICFLNRLIRSRSLTIFIVLLDLLNLFKKLISHASLWSNNTLSWLLFANIFIRVLFIFNVSQISYSMRPKCLDLVRERLWNT